MVNDPKARRKDVVTVMETNLALVPPGSYWAMIAETRPGRVDPLNRVVRWVVNEGPYQGRTAAWQHLAARPDWPVGYQAIITIKEHVTTRSGGHRIISNRVTEVREIPVER